MLFDFRPLLTLSLWLDVDPPSLLGSSLIILSFWLLLWLALSGFFRFKQNRASSNLKAKQWERWFNWGLTWLIFYGLWLFFAYQRIPVLGMRLWFVVFLIIAVIWTGRLLSQQKIYDRKAEKSRQVGGELGS